MNKHKKVIIRLATIFMVICMFLLCTQVSCAGSLDHMLEHKYKLLNKAVGCELIISSGYRSEAHNKAVGGAEHSFHMKGKALDIVPPRDCKTSLKDIAVKAKRLGFNCVIVYGEHIHVDIGRRKYYKGVK